MNPIKAPELPLQLEGLSHRGSNSGRLERRPSRDDQNPIGDPCASQRSRFVGDLLLVRQEGRAGVGPQNRFAVGDMIEIIEPAGNRQVQVQVKVLLMQRADGQPINMVQGNPVPFWPRVSGPAEDALIARML